jgi:quercetin dioxygenase-like cupin family protein
VQAWNLRAIEAPDGTRDPVVLHSNDEARAVLIRIEPGGKLGDHQVKERAWVCVVDGRVRVDGGGETFDAETGWLFMFEPDERHSLRSEEGARILLLLAPWPGSGHYRGGDSAFAAG